MNWLASWMVDYLEMLIHNVIFPLLQELNTETEESNSQDTSNEKNFRGCLLSILMLHLLCVSPVQGFMDKRILIGNCRRILEKQCLEMMGRDEVWISRS